MRMNRAKELFRANPDSFIKDVAAMVGYEDQFYFSRIFRSYTKKSPSEYLKEISKLKMNWCIKILKNYIGHLRMRTARKCPEAPQEIHKSGLYAYKSQKKSQKYVAATKLCIYKDVFKC